MRHASYLTVSLAACDHFDDFNSASEKCSKKLERPSAHGVRGNFSIFSGVAPLEMRLCVVPNEFTLSFASNPGPQTHTKRIETLICENGFDDN